MFNRSKKVAKQFDWLLFIMTIILCLFGFFVLRSATANSFGGARELRSQMIATLLGFGLIAIIQLIDTDALKKLSLPLYIVIVLLLIATKFFGSGYEEWGASSWLSIGPVTFQPAEFGKIGLIIAFAAILEKYRNTLNKLTIFGLVVLSAAIPVGLILLQPDVGTAIVFVFFLALMIFYAGLSWTYIVGAIVLVLVAAPIMYSQLSPTRQLRILNFLDPSRDPLGSNYQWLQGIIAIGSGMLSGRGYMEGPQTQLGFIPEQDTDYIFPVIAEELGFIGGVGLIIGYIILLFCILRVAYNAKDTYGGCICVGIAAMLFFHIFENIGMTLGLMPVTGIPLPFISYGGTFQLINLICIGIVLSIGTQRKPLDFNASY